MKKNNIVIAAVAAVAALSGAAAVYALQSKAAGEGQGSLRGGNNEIRTAIENKDYEAFKEATSERCQADDKITPENFDKFVKMHDLMKQGKVDEAEAIRKELGLPEMMGHGKGRNPEMIKALENNDYNAFKEAVKDKPIAEKVTEGNFSKFVKMHDLRKEGKFEEAKAIADELGLKGPENGKGFGKRGMGMRGENQQ